MSNDDGTKIIPRRTPESAALLASVKRAIAITVKYLYLSIAIEYSFWQYEFG